MEPAVRFVSHIEEERARERQQDEAHEKPVHAGDAPVQHHPCETGERRKTENHGKYKHPYVLDSGSVVSAVQNLCPVR